MQSPELHLLIRQIADKYATVQLSNTCILASAIVLSGKSSAFPPRPEHVIDFARLLMEEVRKQPASVSESPEPENTPQG